MVLVITAVIAKVLEVIAYGCIAALLPERRALGILHNRPVMRHARYRLILDLVPHVLVPVVAAGPQSRLGGLNHEGVLAGGLARTELDVAAWRLPHILVLHVVGAGANLEIVAMNLPGHDQPLHPRVQ